MTFETVIKVLMLAIFTSSIFFFAMAVGRANDGVPVECGPPIAYLLSFGAKATDGTSTFVTVPGIANLAECHRLMAKMTTNKDGGYSCTAYTMAK